MNSTINVEYVAAPQVQQQMYRSVLKALSFPAAPVDVSSFGTALLPILLATLIDENTSAADPDSLIEKEVWQMLGCPQAAVQEAEFILADAQAPVPIGFRPRLGEIYAPEKSATLILYCRHSDCLSIDAHVSGPGIDSINQISIAGLHPSWLEARSDWVAKFPTGIDILLVTTSCMYGLPRTSTVNWQ